MSTSSRVAPVASVQPDVRPFLYAEVGQENAAGAPGNRAAPLGQEALSAVPNASLSREQMVEENGRRAGEAQARAAFEAQLQQLRESVRRALEDFARERASYYERVEGEVVQLALAIARKILHREAQSDPLLLAGIVRVALDQIEDNTKVSLRVNREQEAQWVEFFRSQPSPHGLPEVHADSALEPGRCILQTSLGTTELGVEVQLKEIERGFLDLLAKRPQSGA